MAFVIKMGSLNLEKILSDNWISKAVSYYITEHVYAHIHIQSQVQYLVCAPPA